MICPDCGHDNIEGVDTCETCEASLSGLEVPDTELERTLSSCSIDDLEPKHPVTVAVDATAADALARMNELNIGCVLVHSGDKLAGILTERDVLNKVTGDPDGREKRASEIMTPDPECVTGLDSLAYALHLMDLGGYRHLPVTDDGRPVGILSVRDILRYVSNHVADVGEAGAAS